MAERLPQYLRKKCRCQSRSRGKAFTPLHDFSFLIVGDDWVLCFAALGESTTVVPSSPEPSSEAVVPVIVLLSL